MASLRAAQAAARKYSQRRNEVFYVIYEPEEGDGSNDHGYHIATAYDLATYWGGISEANIVRAYMPGWED